MESILTSIKKLLGIAEEYVHFDADLISHINSVFCILNQIGVGPAEGFSITGKTETWNDFIPDSPQLSSVQAYMLKKVKLLFDPPTNSTVMTSTNAVVSELEWRLNVAAESMPDKEEA